MLIAAAAFGFRIRGRVISPSSEASAIALAEDRAGFGIEVSGGAQWHFEQILLRH
jgi:hypothetical protein